MYRHLRYRARGHGPKLARMARTHIALRKGRRSIAGQIYLVTFTTARRHPTSPAMERRRRCGTAHDGNGELARFTPARLGTHAGSLAWTHRSLGEGEALSARVGRIKGSTLRGSCDKAHPGLGRIWAVAYHDRALRKEEDLLQVARYVVMNPVRAGLVARVGDYPFWDAVWL